MTPQVPEPVVPPTPSPTGDAAKSAPAPHPDAPAQTAPADAAPRPPRPPRAVQPRFTHVVIEPAAVAALLSAYAGSKTEVCGLIVGKRVGETAHIRNADAIPNAHPTPERGFLLSTREALESARAARAAGHAILGTFHGHLRGAPFPSAADVAGLQAASLGPGNAAAPNALPHVFLIIGRGAGTQPVMRAWTWRMQRLREIPMRVATPVRAAG